jgi:hypothetical protein
MIDDSPLAESFRINFAKIGPIIPASQAEPIKLRSLTKSKKLGSLAKRSAGRALDVITSKDTN